jgi:acylphosphatase
MRPRRPFSVSRFRVNVFYSGRVQGVGFRYTTKTRASGFDVTGTVRNLPDGRVELVAEGERRELEDFLADIRDSEVGRFIKDQQVAWSEAKQDLKGFEIVR